MRPTSRSARSTVVFALLVVCPVVAAGCAASAPAPAQPLGSPPPVPSASAAMAPPGAPAPSTPLSPVAQDSLLDLVPANAVWAAIVRRNALAPLRAAYTADPGLRSDLATWLDATIGLDLTRLDGLVAFSLAARPDAAAVLLRLSGDAPVTLRGEPLGRVGGVDVVRVEAKVVAASLATGVVIGDEANVAAAIALSKRESSPLGPGSPLAEVAALDPRGIDLLLAAYGPALQQPDLAGSVQTFGVRLAMLSFDQGGTLSLEVRGDPQKLAQLRDVVKQVVSLGINEAERRKQEATQGKAVLEGVAAIVAYHLVEEAAREAEPRLEGDRLVARYRLPRFEGTAAFVPYAAAGAAFAVPAFARYLDRARTAEAMTNLRALRDGVIAWHAAHHGDGRKFAFPATTPWTPTLPCCNQPNQQCRGTASDFAAPTWKALGFAPAGPHRFQYRFVSEGRGAKAHFLVEARADLECDGDYTLYSLQGGIGKGGALELGEIAGGGGDE